MAPGSLALMGLAATQGCYLTHERHEDAAVPMDAPRRDGGDAQLATSEEAVLAFVDGRALQLVLADGRSGPRLPYGDATIVHLRSEGTQMGGVAHRGGRLAPLVFNAFGEVLRSEETSMLIDPARSRVEASTFHRGTYAFGVTHGLAGDRVPLGGLFTEAGLRPWDADCLPFGTSTPLGGRLALACPGPLQFDLHVTDGAASTRVELDGAGVAFPRDAMSDSSVFHTSRGAIDDLVLLHTESTRTSLGAVALMAESDDEVVVRVDDRCLRRVQKRTTDSEQVCRPETIRQAALTRTGELYVVEGDAVRRLVRVRDGRQVSERFWSTQTDLIAAGNTLALRALAAPDVPDGFTGARESLVWLVDGEHAVLHAWDTPVVLPSVRLSRDGRYAAFVRRWVGRDRIDATWMEVDGVPHEVQAVGPTAGIADDIAFFHGPDVVMR